MKPVIFTDLDGTLLDRSYSFKAASAALERIRREGVPLVITTSKTRAEVVSIREALGNDDPFITENGGGVFIPEGAFPFPVKGEQADGCRMISLGAPYPELRRAVEDARAAGFSMRGFGDMDAEEISRATGLPLDAARLSKERQFDEPFFTEGADGASAARLRRFMEARGLRVTTGRLSHLTGRSDKGAAAAILMGLYRSLYGRIATIGAGDAGNDMPLLALVDYPVLVAREDGLYEDEGAPEGVIRAAGAGPAGWAKAVTGVLDTIKASGGYTC